MIDSDTLDGCLNERLEGLIDSDTLDGRLNERLEGVIDNDTLDGRLNERLEGLIDSDTLDGRLNERLEGVIDSDTLDGHLNERLEGLIDSDTLDGRLNERLEGVIDADTLDGRLNERLEGLIDADTLDGRLNERLEDVPTAETLEEKLGEKLEEFEKTFEEKLSGTMESMERIDELAESLMRNTINIESLTVNNHEMYQRITEIQDSMLKLGEGKDELLEKASEKAKEEVARVEEVALSRPKLEWNHFAQGLYKLRENLGLDQRESWWMHEFSMGWEMLVERVQDTEQSWIPEETVEEIMQQVMDNPRYKVLRELGAIERAGATYGQAEEGTDANPVALVLQTVSRLMIVGESVGGTGMELQNDQGQVLSGMVMKIVSDLYLAITSGGVEEPDEEQFRWLNSIAEVVELLLHLPRLGKAFDPFSSKVAGQEESGFGGWHHGGTVKSIVKPGFHSAEGEIIEYAVVELEES